ncbi:MAG: hypothetical protein KF700_01875 [Hyphomonadaceae bacterium]|nr:hypothetical protein [Hyphomonadaceae bacterium]
MANADAWCIVARMLPRNLTAAIASSLLLVGCGVYNPYSGASYARSISERAFAHGEGEATVSQVFGGAPQTCIGIGDREEALAALNPQARQALEVRGRDQYSVVVVQFDDTGRITLRRQFHIRSPFVYIDIGEQRFSGSAARCLGPTDVVEVGLTRLGRERMAGIRIP